MSRRRTFREVEDAAVARERAAVVAFLAAKCGEVEAMADRGAVDRESGTLLIRRLAAISDQIEQKLHISEEVKPCCK